MKRQALALLVPYFFFAFVTFAYWALIETRVRPVDEGTSIAQQFVNIFYPMSGIPYPYTFDVVLWFLPCLFIVSASYHYLRKLSLKTVIGGGYLFNTLVIIFFGLLADNVHLTLPFYLTTAFGAMAFYAFGGLANSVKAGRLMVKEINECMLGSIALVLVVGRWFFDSSNDMMCHSYEDGFWLFFILASTMTASLYFIIKRLPERQFVSYIGSNTLIIMCLHEPLKRIVIQLYAFALHQPALEIRHNVILTLLITITTIALLLPVVWGINRYLPWLIGKTKLKT